ncbi:MULTISPECIES: hypothetical protein [Brachybacterium]|uniref:hypothetical protein n=1 Tax=Brachybacterium TaxID=43668 RepID=UPI001314706C|nr:MULTISPECIES: hypothetical protein [Brachybacterium]
MWSGSDDHAAHQGLAKLELVVSEPLDEADLFSVWGETRLLRSVEDIAEVK